MGTPVPSPLLPPPIPDTDAGLALDAARAAYWEDPAGALAEQCGDGELEWWNYPVDPKEEGWVFIDTTTGLPPRAEFHNRVWHKVRRWVDKNDAEHAWPEVQVRPALLR